MEVGRERRAKRAASPASTGPSGPHFEGQVGAHYLLSMLAGAEPRGLPGTSIQRIELQRAAEGRPLDDVIVHALDNSSGETAVLEIQVKRTITFAPSDPLFRSVVEQVVEASRRPEFFSTRYELAIATARTSQKISGPYQDVLTWARQIGDPGTFVARIARRGSANDDMRRFVDTFRSHIRRAGARDGDRTVWELLRRLQILVFDFTATGSASEALATERAVRVLHPQNIDRAPALWSSVIEIALRVAASGGERDFPTLINELREQSFRFAGERRYETARAALAEVSRNALDDIRDSVGGVKLTRHQYIRAVRLALDGGRFVEIRGDVGVGKSGVLKHFADQIKIEGNAVVLSPGRTTPNGWVAMRDVIGFDGTARELLLDLASGGATALFVDNLDSFTEGEKKTVVDLVVAAAEVPGVAVIATARTRFGMDQPSWLPADAVSHLGSVGSILVEELSDAEMDEIRHAAPALRPLLSETSPARDIVRNLFHLDFQAGEEGEEPISRTEVEMAHRWWRTGGARPGEHQRERCRLLRFLGRQALSRDGPLVVSDRPADVVDMLVEDETLRDLGNDRVLFRHDVLREWAVANILHSNPSLVDAIALDRPASAMLARGLELVARMKLGHAIDSTDWKTLLDRVSSDDIHGSWRRAVLLALVRSENADELLNQTADHLLAQEGGVLTELIHLTKAVDGRPASDALRAGVVISPEIIGGMVLPAGLSWYRLIRWLLSLDDARLEATLPYVVDLYISWSIATGGKDPLAGRIAIQVFRWLVDREQMSAPPTPFDREPEMAHRALTSQLRMLFLFLCDKVPELAVQYLRLLQRRRPDDRVVRRVLKSPGSLVKAAPEELVEFFLWAFVLDERNSVNPEPHRVQGPFRRIGDEFLPPSPAQQPFFPLLSNAPQIGLSLIRQLVDHATSFHQDRYGVSDDPMYIPLASNPRDFEALQSYTWSRPESSDTCVASALMALEAWAHRRVEGGEDFEGVLHDVLGVETAAAYLLVAVDLIISHWPNSQEAAIPFLASPELLCIDRQRFVQDSFEFPDVLGLKSLQKEPIGVVTAEDLESRLSRRCELYQLLRHYTFGSEERRNRLRDLLRSAASRIGSPEEHSDLSDPSFMTLHALNVLDPGNWQESVLAQDDGTKVPCYAYVPPEAEQRHLAPMQEAARVAQDNVDMQMAVGIALEDRSRSSAKFAANAVAWARSATMEWGDREMDIGVAQAIVGAAMIMMRDGDAASRTQHREWACGVFDQIRQETMDSIFRARTGLRFNPMAMAFVGRVHVLGDDASMENVDGLLQLVIRHPGAAAHGWRLTAGTLAATDTRLPQAVLRCAFHACIRSRHDLYLTDHDTERAAIDQQRREDAVKGELTW